MRDIIDNWRRWKDQLLIEQGTLKITKPGIQPGDPNIGEDYVKIAESELQQWKRLGNPRHGDPSGRWRQPIAKYWASIGKGFEYFVPKTLSATGSKNQLYGRGKKNPAWSAAFIQYCMIASGDSSWKKVNAAASENRGTISNHKWYWYGMFDNSLILQAKKQLSPDDWVFVPLTEADQRARGNRSGKILFTGSDIGYTNPNPGDLVLVVSKKGNREGYHGDIITSSGRVGGNTAPWGRVGSSTSPAVVILTKNPLVKKNVLQVLNNKKQER